MNFRFLQLLHPDYAGYDPNTAQGTGGGHCMDAAVVTMGALTCLGAGSKGNAEMSKSKSIVIGKKPAKNLICEQPTVTCSVRSYPYTNRYKKALGKGKNRVEWIRGHFAVECSGNGNPIHLIDYTHGQMLPPEDQRYDPRVGAKPLSYKFGFDDNTMKQAEDLNTIPSFETWLDNDCGSNTEDYPWAPGGIPAMHFLLSGQTGAHKCTCEELKKIFYNNR